MTVVELEVFDLRLILVAVETRDLDVGRVLRALTELSPAHAPIAQAAAVQRTEIGRMHLLQLSIWRERHVHVRRAHTPNLLTHTDCKSRGRRRDRLDAIVHLEDHPSPTEPSARGRGGRIFVGGQRTIFVNALRTHYTYST